MLAISYRLNFQQKRIASETHGKDYSRYSGVQASDVIAYVTLRLYY